MSQTEGRQRSSRSTVSGARAVFSERTDHPQAPRTPPTPSYYHSRTFTVDTLTAESIDPPATPSSVITTSSFSSGEVDHNHLSAASASVHRVQRRSSIPPRIRPEDLSGQLWLHPDITNLIETLLLGIAQDNFSFSRAWLLMQIMDLQIVYQLLSSPISFGGNADRQTHFKVPKNCIPSPRLVLRCAMIFSKRHVHYHIPPMSWVEREIQLRVLVSSLSLLHLFAPNKKGPYLSIDALDQLKDNIAVLGGNIQSGGGSAADKGDCEFLVRYALNLLGHLPGDESVSSALVGRVWSFLCAAGTAYQYNGRDTIDNLRKAFRPLRTKATHWHAEIDQYHHVTMALLSLSQYSSTDPYKDKAQQMFRTLCTEFVGTLRGRLRDQLATLKDRPTLGTYWGKFTTRAADVAGLDPADNPTNLTYGLMYLICRLVERLVAVGGGREGDEERNMQELIKLLASICQTSKFEELKYKAHEIIFQALSNAYDNVDLSAHAHLVELPIPEKTSAVDRQKREQENAFLVQQWNSTMSGLRKRRKWAENSFTPSDEEVIMRFRRGYAQPSLVQEHTEPGSLTSSRSSQEGVTVPSFLIAPPSLSDRVEQSTTAAATFVRNTGHILSKIISPASDTAIDSENITPTMSSPRFQDTSHRHLRRKESTEYPYPHSPHSITGKLCSTSYDAHSSPQPIPIATPRMAPEVHQLTESPRQSPGSPGYALMGSAYLTSQQPRDIHSPPALPPSMPARTAHGTIRARRADTLESSNSPGSHKSPSLQSTGDEWKESPRPFDLDALMIGVQKKRVKGNPETVRLSASCKTVAFVSKDQIDVYSVPLPPVTAGGELGKRRSHAFRTKRNSSKKIHEFINAAVNDTHLAAITRDKLELVDLATGQTFDQSFDVEESQRLCTVAVAPHCPVVGVAFLDAQRRCAVRLYERGHNKLELQRTLFCMLKQLPEGVSQGEPKHLLFSSDGEHLICTSDTHGWIGTWDLREDNDSAVIIPDNIPVNDGRGGMDGVTSAKMFPSNKYVLATTGSTDGAGAAFITASSLSRTKPKLHRIIRPTGPLITCAVAENENAIALVTSKGEVFVSRLAANSMSGFKACEPSRLAKGSRILTAEAGFVRTPDKNVLVVAFGGTSRVLSDGYGEIMIFEFEAEANSETSS